MLRRAARTQRAHSTVEHTGRLQASSRGMAHCSYLDIYISQNIWLWKGDFEGKVQSNLKAKTINFFIRKIRFIKLIFLLFFAEFVKSSAFYTLLLLFQRVDMFELWFLHQIAIQTCQLFGIAATVCKKQWIWQILQKIEENWVKYIWVSDQKVKEFGL